MHGHLNLRQSPRPFRFEQLPVNTLFYVTQNEKLKGKLLLKVDHIVGQNGDYNTICVNDPLGNFMFPPDKEFCYKVIQHFN